MNGKWSFYDLETGLFSGRTFSGPQGCKENTPIGHGAHEGQVDHLSQRKDLNTGALVDYQPPQPSPDHEWSADQKRWQLSTAAQQRLIARELALARIAVLEASQHRAIRESALAYDGAKARLQAIDDEIVKLRVTLAT